MQQLGYLNIGGKKVLVLVRSQKNGVALKLRKSGVDGQHMSDEEAFLAASPECAAALLRGKVIYC